MNMRNVKSVVLPIAGVTVLMFILQLAVPGLTDLLKLDSDFIFSRPWMIVTHMFMHSTAGYGHIFFNMFALVMFGPLLEQRIGPKRFLALYFGGGVFAGIMFALFRPGIPALGASGAIMAMLGALIILMPRLKLLLFFVLPIPLWMAGILWVLMDVFGLFNPASAVGNVAHLAGMAAGLGSGLYWKRKSKSYQKGFGMKSHLNDDDIEQYVRRGRL